MSPGAASTGGPRVLIAGGGAAGFFAAITCAEADPSASVTLHEATAHPLAKVRVSGGGRCNVTHACFDPGELVRAYPRGARELLGPMHRFGPAETVAWFTARGVELKTEGDGRMFPTTDDSATIVDCLRKAAESAGVRVVLRSGVASVARSMAGAADSGGPGMGGPGERGRGAFSATLTTGAVVETDRILLATGGTKGSSGLAIAEALGHAIVPPVPSLFTFHIDDPRLRGLEGLSVSDASASVAGAGLRARGPILVTHWGLSGPAILKLSSLEARRLNEAAYRFAVVVNWAEGGLSLDRVAEELGAQRARHARRRIVTSNPFGVPGRLWERLVAASGIGPEATWANLPGEGLKALAAHVAAGRFDVTGKSMNKEEFVTCGGVALWEVDFATMESRICPGLHFAGEILDIDGITGGFNFQAAWTTGWHAGRAMASAPGPESRPSS